jgi:hypothetical protein
MSTDEPGFNDEDECPPEEDDQDDHDGHLRHSGEGICGAIGVRTDDGCRPKYHEDNERTKALDLKVLEVEQCVDELLNVNVPRTIKIALDSGAGDHVAGKDQVGARSVRMSSGRRRGQHFIDASGNRIENQGESELHMVEPGGKTIKSVFQVADVTRALYGVSKMCDDGCEVHFTATEAVVTKGGKVITRFGREGGLYTVELEIKPDTGVESPFVGPGVNR